MTKKKIYEGYNDVWASQLTHYLRGMGYKAKKGKEGKKICVYRID